MKSNKLQDFAQTKFQHCANGRETNKKKRHPFFSFSCNIWTKLFTFNKLLYLYRV